MLFRWSGVILYGKGSSITVIGWVNLRCDVGATLDIIAAGIRKTERRCAMTAVYIVIALVGLMFALLCLMGARTDER
jgi:hypothetical protein